MEYTRKQMQSSITLAVNQPIFGYYYEPLKCPICKRNIKPNFLFGYLNIEKSMMYIVFECLGCNRCFIKSCKCEFKNIRRAGESYTGLPAEAKELNSNAEIMIAPNPPVPITFSEYISKTSEKFIEIYNQANAAECYGLNEIAGIGYRKSLEFLIKDFLANPVDDEEKCEAIKKKPLGSCIKDDINNENLRIAASRAVWIGNDETHYIRKHDDKDIIDLKRLIDLTVRWIEMECMTKEAQGIPYIK